MNKYTALFLNPLYWPIWFLLSILWLIVQLPHRARMGVGRCLGRLFYLFPTKLKKTTTINIQLCFPHYTKAEQTTLVKNNFASLGIGLIEAGMAWWLPDSQLQYAATVHGLEHLHAAYAKNKGIILVGPHFTSLEIIARLLGMQYEFAIMFRPHKKALISFIHERFRKHKAVTYVPRNRMRDVLRILNNNKPIWYAYDVDGGKKSSVFAPFFGIQTASLTIVSRLAALSGAAIVPISFYRRDNELGYDIYLSPALENFPSNDLVTDATQLNASVEQAIRFKPEQYVWQYKRFKTRPPGEKRFY